VAKATIAAAPPVANAGGPYTGMAGIAVSFSGAGSSDPQGEALTYAWNFGDGSTGTGASPSHTYTAPGTYTVMLSVTNTSGLVGGGTSKATIAAAPSSVALTGLVYGGQQPIVGAHVYLLAANTTGNAGNGIAASSSNASVSLLGAAETGTSDSIGAYVLSGSNGGFSLTGDYVCTSGQQLYLYALGGNSGSGANSSSGLLAAIGACPSNSAPAIFAMVNEVSTVATAYSMAGFATDATHVSSSGTALAQVGIANAFANPPNLETLSTGVALYSSPVGGYDYQQTLDAVADILAACVSSAGTVVGPSSPTPCYTLFNNAKSAGPTGTVPGDTATAAINIAHNEGANVTALYALASASSPFQPESINGVSFVIGIQFFGVTSPTGIAIDGSGNVWVSDSGPFQPSGLQGVVEFSGSGSILSAKPYGFTGGGISYPTAIAIDPSGNVWVSNGPNNSVSELSSTGSPISGAAGYTGGGLNGSYGIAIDGSGDAWVTNASGNSVTELSATGSILSGTNGYTGGGLSGPGGIAIDASGNVWVANNAASSVTKLSGTGAPLSGTSGYTGGGLSAPNNIAIDGNGDVWALGFSTSNHITELSNTGAVLLGVPNADFATGLAIDGSGDVWNSTNSSGYYSCCNYVNELSGTGSILVESATIPGIGVAVDGSGNVWELNPGGVTEFVGAGVPVVTPLAVGVKNNALGTRP
jgi:PKD repeat protein